MPNTKTKTPRTTEPAAHADMIHAHDAEIWKDLVQWSRAHGVALSELRVGEVHAFLTDVLPRGPVQPQQQSDAEAAAGMYEKYGGEMLKAAIEQAPQQPEEDDEEYDEDDAPARRPKR